MIGLRALAVVILLGLAGCSAPSGPPYRVIDITNAGHPAQAPKP